VPQPTPTTVIADSSKQRAGNLRRHTFLLQNVLVRNNLGEFSCALSRVTRKIRPS
jgi:hypothetical protein